MKITDDMLTEWRKEFEAWYVRDVPEECREQVLQMQIASRNIWGEYPDRMEASWLAWQAARRTTPDRECEWKCDDIDNGIWESACGETWSFIDGGPVENRMLFCHRCGGKLKTAPTSDKGGAPSQPFSLTEDDPQEGVAFQYAHELVAKRLRGDKGGA